VYILWNQLLRKLKPDIDSDIISESRKMVVRFFIVYELFFGINIFALLLR
jgi:hypothetical protein